AVTFADEVTLPGSTIAIRKFPENPLSMAHLLQLGTLTPLMAAYLWLVAEYKGFIMTIGAMGTGKTTCLNCILTMIDPTLKIATVEDVPELKIPHTSWQRFKARHTYSITEAKFDVDLMDLVKLSLRYRPDYIVVGEVRGEEVRALIQAAALGHGCLCLPGDEPLAFMNGRSLRLAPIGELVEGTLEGKYKDVSVFSMDPKTWKLVPSKVKRVFKVPSDGKVLRIRLEGGKEFRVSPDHPLLVLDENGLMTKQAANVKSGECVPVVKKIPVDNIMSVLDLLELQEIRKLPKVYVELRGEALSALNAEEVRRGLYRAGYSCYNLYDWSRGRGAMPLSAYFVVEELSNTKIFRERLRLRYGPKSKSYNSIPARLSLDEDFGAVVGWYLAEGCIPMRRKTLLLYFGRPKEMYVGHLYRSLEKAFGILPKTYKYKKENMCIDAQSKILALVFEKLFGSNSYNKKLPEFILQTPEPFRKALIRWYWLGDGTSIKRGKNALNYSASTSSKDLAQGLIWVLKSLGIDASIYVVREENGGIINGRRISSKSPHYTIRIAGGSSSKKFAEIMRSSLTTRYSFADVLPSFLLKRRVKGRNIVWFTATNEKLRGHIKQAYEKLLGGDVYFARVVEVAEEPYEGWLYDVETEHGNFVHSTCVVTHNCSIHGESPEAALIRMKSPPMDVPEGNLMLIWCFVLLGRVRLPDGTMVRRVLEVTEVEPKDGRIELKRLFTWNARSDTFTPEDAEAVVKRSYRLKAIQRMTGMTDEELADELRRRAEYLEKAVEEGKLLYPDFAEAVRRFYALRWRRG
ncbi:MAG: ATPase, T2SS/T4P/T4SS family, partial [Candidatus Methanomethylicaceae archaeon]